MGEVRAFIMAHLRSVYLFDSDAILPETRWQGMVLAIEDEIFLLGQTATYANQPTSPCQIWSDLSPTMRIVRVSSRALLLKLLISSGTGS